MKKLLITCLFTAIISYSFGNYIYTSYKNTVEKIISSSSITQNVYMVLYGSYNSMDKVNALDIKDYILTTEGGFYKVYVGVSLSLENANKIKEIYKVLGNSIYIREKSISNFEFLEYISSYEEDFSNLEKEKILSMEKNIIDKYKELVNE